MTPHEATIYAAIIATAGALLGGIIGSLGTYFIQRHALSNETIEHGKRTLINNEIKALQQYSLLIDFLEANAGHINADFKFFTQLWSIVHECSRDIAYLPSEIRDEARNLIKVIYQGAGEGDVNLEANIFDLRSTILDKIDSLKGTPANKQVKLVR